MTYETWINGVKDALASVNMPMDEWQQAFRFDFRQEYESGTLPAQAAEKANRFWWHHQNKDIGQACAKTPECWLPNGHQGICQRV